MVTRTLLSSTTVTLKFAALMLAEEMMRSCLLMSGQRVSPLAMIKYAELTTIKIATKVKSRRGILANIPKHRKGYSIIRHKKTDIL